VSALWLFLAVLGAPLLHAPILREASPLIVGLLIGLGTVGGERARAAPV
jgi:hypothetical protein